MGSRYGSAHVGRQRGSYRLCYRHRTFQAAAAAAGKFYSSEELQASFSALLRLPAGAKAPEAGKHCPFWKAWPKSSEVPLEGLTPFEHLLKLCQRGSNPFEALVEGQESRYIEHLLGPTTIQNSHCKECNIIILYYTITDK